MKILPPRRALAGLFFAALVATACGASDWRRPRSATDPSDPGAAEAPPRPAPALNDAAPPPPTEAPAPGHEHHHHHGGDKEGG